MIRTWGQKQTESQLSISNREVVQLPKLNQSKEIANPFFMPQESQIFQLKEKQRERKDIERQKNSTLKVWQKGIKHKDNLSIRKLNDLCKIQQPQSKKMNIVDAANKAIKSRVWNKQPRYQFIDKKREMLLFQMMIDHKRQVINNYQQLTRLHRSGLQRSEQMLEEDIEAFNQYLNVNKRDARKQIKEAEQKAKRRNDLTTKIKELVENKAENMGKNTTKLQQLQNARKYKEFLDNLNPHISEIKERKRKQKQLNRQRRQHQKIDLSIYSGSVSAELAQLLQQSDEEQQMYFTDPEDLMKIFINFEENNLYLISTTSDFKQTLEDLKKKNEETKRKFEIKRQELNQHKIQNMRQEENIIAQIQKLKKIKNNSQADVLLKQLNTEIPKILKDLSNLSDPLQVLKDVQRKIQDCLEQLNQISAESELKYKEIVKKVQKKKQHRVDRQMRVQVQIKTQEPRRQKRVGRPIMAKSSLQKEKVIQKVETPISQQEIERRKYFM